MSDKADIVFFNMDIALYEKLQIFCIEHNNENETKRVEKLLREFFKLIDEGKNV